MLELIKYIVGQFAEEKDKVDYQVEESEDEITVTVFLADSDMGKVIGKQGKIAKALRTLVRAATPKDSRNAKREMDSKFILLIISWAAILAGIVLIVLYYTINLSVIYGSACLAVGAIVSLIAVLLRRKEMEERKEEERRKSKRSKK